MYIRWAIVYMVIQNPIYIITMGVYIVPSLLSWFYLIACAQAAGGCNGWKEWNGLVSGFSTGFRHGLPQSKFWGMTNGMTTLVWLSVWHPSESAYKWLSMEVTTAMRSTMMPPRPHSSALSTLILKNRRCPFSCPVIIDKSQRKCSYVISQRGQYRHYWRYT